MQSCAPQVLFLSDGVVWHSDDRRNSVAAGVQWAVQNSLQGLVLECEALRSQPKDAAAARQHGLEVNHSFVGSKKQPAKRTPLPPGNTALR